MGQEPHPPRNTQEFVTGWQNIVEQHVVGDLAGALHKLAASERGGAPALARHVSHALRLAASPTGGLQAAVQYLCQAADHPDEP